MTENILGQILNSAISTEAVLNWLTTDDPNDTVIPNVEQTHSLRAEFILYFLDFLRKQCQGLRFVGSDGSETENASVSTGQRLDESGSAQSQVFANSQYGSPQSHSSPFKRSNGTHLSWYEGDSTAGELSPAMMSRWPINDSCVSNSSIISTVPCSPISPLSTGQVIPTESRAGHRNQSRKSSNNMSSPGLKTNSGQKNKKSERNHTLCLGDFLPETLDGKQRNKRRIKPTKVVVDNNAENEQALTFGVVSRPPTTNPTFIEALSTDETSEVRSFEDERELLKLQRQRQSMTPLITQAVLQERTKSSIRPKQMPAIFPKLHLVKHADIVKILAELYGGLIIRNLVPNPMTELYFTVSLITSQYKTDCEVDKTQSKRPETVRDETESLKNLKEMMGCEDLINDNSGESIHKNIKKSMVEGDNSAVDESNEMNNEKLSVSERQYFETVNNCVYFATIVLWNGQNLLSVFDRPTLALLCGNPLVQEFHPTLCRFLNKLYEEKCSRSKNVKPYDYLRSSQSNVCFQVDTDNRDNFPTVQAFCTFRRQRDLFYDILETWKENHLNRDWSFRTMLGNKINAMLSMHSDAVNYYHLARLFKSQLLISSMMSGQAEESFHDASFGVLKSLKDLNPEKLQQLQQRFVTPISLMGPVPPPSFPGIQGFYKKFLLVSSDSKFNTNLQDCFIQEIMELNDTQFTYSDIDAKQSGADESTKQKYLLCVSNLRLLAKFLGFLITLPYQSSSDTLQSKTTQIALRSRIMPPVDLRGCLHQAIAHKMLSVTIPWMVQYLAMLDSISFRLPYYSNLCKSLYCIYRRTKYSLHDEAALLVAFSIGWLFGLPNFPKDIYFRWMESLKDHKDKSVSSLTVYPCRNVWEMNDDADANLLQNDCVIDELNIIDDRALYICCPYLKELKLLLMSGNTNLNSNNANRHITPVSSKLSQASCATRTVGLELQLEEAFFHGHPRSVRKTVDFVVERIASSCVKFICRSIIPAIKNKSFDTAKKTTDEFPSRDAIGTHDLIVSTTEKIRDQCYKTIPGMCESKTKSSMESLLADDILPAVRDMCVKIAVRMEIEQIYQWLDSYINNALTSRAKLLEFSSLRVDGEDRDDDDEDENGPIGRTRRVECDNDDVPWATSVLNCIRYSLWALLEDNGRWSTLDAETILDNVNKIYQSLTGSKIMKPNTRQLLYQMSYDYALHLIALKPDLFTPEVEGKLIEVWKTYNNGDDASRNEPLPGLLSPRNVKILISSADNTVWVRYGKFIQRMFKHNLVSMDNFSNDCVSLMRYEWSLELWESFSKCITEAIFDHKPGGGECVQKIMMLLNWIIHTCGTMDVYA